MVDDVAHQVWIILKTQKEVYLAESSEQGMFNPLLLAFNKRVPDVEVRHVPASQVAAPDIIILPDLHGPVRAEQLLSNILWNTCKNKIKHHLVDKGSSNITSRH